MKNQKRIKLKHGTAHVDENCSPEVVESLNTLAELAYSMDFKSIQLTKVKIDIRKNKTPDFQTQL